MQCKLGAVRPNMLQRPRKESSPVMFVRYCTTQTLSVAFVDNASLLDCIKLPRNLIQYSEIKHLYNFNDTVASNSKPSTARM